ncbi:MAG: hypothetical protein JO040_15105 [Gemmatimonadetes bacterium]|nr:hypothetical protein [Gemmatimonadota bacterium]
MANLSRIWIKSVLMLKRWMPLLGAGLIAAACERAEGVDKTTGGFPPFDRLGTVRLGIQARDLARARPGAHPEAYLGYREVVAGYRVGYLIPGSYSEGQEVPAGARLTGVSTTKWFDRSPVALEAWTSAVRTAHPELNVPTPQCFRVVGAIAPEKVAVWKQGRTGFEISFYGAYTDRHAGGWSSFPASVGAELRREDLGAYLMGMLLPVRKQRGPGPRRVSEPCPRPPARSHGG